MTLHTGRHFLQIPGPTNVPDRVLRAIDMPTLDHRGAEFAVLGHEVLAAVQRVFRTKQPVIIYPSSGTGAWEAAIVNTLSPGDKVLMSETGQFAALWLGIANKFMEPYFGAVLGKIIILVLIILFIQRRPRGLFALKGRAVEQ